MNKFPIWTLLGLGTTTLFLLGYFSYWQIHQVKDISNLYQYNQNLENLRTDINIQLNSIELSTRLAAYSGLESWENVYYDQLAKLNEDRRKADIIGGVLSQFNSLNLAVEHFKKLAEQIFSKVRREEDAKAREIAESLNFEETLEELNEAKIRINQLYQSELSRGQEQINAFQAPLYWFAGSTGIILILILFLGIRALSKWNLAINSLNGELSRLVEIKTKELEEQSAQMIITSRLATIGEVSAGIGHEINNPLSVIMARAALLEKRLEKHPEINEELKITDDLKKIRLMSERISKIVRGLKSLSRAGNDDAHAPAKVATIIEGSLALLEQQFRANSIELKLNVPPDVNLICNETQIVQVLVNTINNAIDAAKDTANPWVELDYKLLPNGMEIHVTDSGAGISAEIADKMFNPFFTSKQPGKGTGLGLPLARKIMDNHGGTVDLARDHKNTRFVFKFPISIVKTS